MRRRGSLWTLIPVLLLLAGVGGSATGWANMGDGLLIVEVTVGEAGAAIEGWPVGLDQPPVLVSGRTFVPFRFLGEALGARIAWDEQLRQVSAGYEETRVVLTVDSATAYIDGQPTALDAPARLVNDRLMVPLRFLAEAFGWDVLWDGATQTATIKRPSRDWVWDLPLGSATRDWPLPSLSDKQWLRFQAEAGTVYAATLDGEDAWALMTYVCDASEVAVAGTVNGYENPEEDWTVDDPSFLFQAPSSGPCYFQVQTVLEGYCPELPSHPYGLNLAVPIPVSPGEPLAVDASPSGATLHRWFRFEAKTGRSYQVTVSSGSDDIALYGPGPDFTFLGHSAAPVVKGATAETYYVAVGATEAYTLTVSQIP